MKTPSGDIVKGRTRRAEVDIAPGLPLAEGPLNQVQHHTILAHGLAVQAWLGRNVLK
jgi:hypothetical protein